MRSFIGLRFMFFSIFFSWVGHIASDNWSLRKQINSWCSSTVLIVSTVLSVACGFLPCKVLGLIQYPILSLKKKNSY